MNEPTSAPEFTRYLFVYITPEPFGDPGNDYFTARTLVEAVTEFVKGHPGYEILSVQAVQRVR